MMFHEIKYKDRCINMRIDKNWIEKFSNYNKKKNNDK